MAPQQPHTSDAAAPAASEVSAPGAPASGAPASGAPASGAPASDAPVPDAFGQGPRKLPRPVYVKWIISVVFLCLVVASFLTVSAKEYISSWTFLDEALGQAELYLGILAACLLIGITLTWFYLRSFSWELRQRDMHFESGLIFIHRTNIPYTRIHAIDDKADILDRFLGIVALNIQTGGGASPEAVFPGLSLSEAEFLRSELFRRKALALAELEDAREDGAADSASAAGADATVTSSADVVGASGTQDSTDLWRNENFLGRIFAAQMNYRGRYAGKSYAQSSGPILSEYHLSTKETLLSALSGGGSGVMVVGFLVSILSFLYSLPWASFVISFLEARFSLASGHGVWALVGFLALLILAAFAVLYLVVIVGNILSYGAFTVRRIGDRLEIEHGILTHRFRAVSLGRIQSITIKQGFIRRIFGYCCIIISTVAVSDSGSETKRSKKSGSTQLGIYLHPFIKISEATSFINNMVPEFASAPNPKDLVGLPLEGRSKARNHYGVFPAVIVALILLIPAAVLGILDFFEGYEYDVVYYFLGTPLFFYISDILVAIVVLIVGIITGRRAFRNAALAYNQDFLVLRSGPYAVSTVIIPRRRIQHLSVSSNPFQRRSKVETLKVRTAASGSAGKNSQTNISQDDGSTLLQWIKPRPSACPSPCPQAQTAARQIAQQAIQQ